MIFNFATITINILITMSFAVLYDVLQGSSVQYYYLLSCIGTVVASICYLLSCRLSRRLASVRSSVGAGTANGFGFRDMIPSASAMALTSLVEMSANALNHEMTMQEIAGIHLWLILAGYIGSAVFQSGIGVLWTARYRRGTQPQSREFAKQCPECKDEGHGRRMHYILTLAICLLCLACAGVVFVCVVQHRTVRGILQEKDLASTIAFKENRIAYPDVSMQQSWELKGIWSVETRWIALAAYEKTEISVWDQRLGVTLEQLDAQESKWTWQWPILSYRRENQRGATKVDLVSLDVGGLLFSLIIIFLIAGIVNIAMSGWTEMRRLIRIRRGCCSRCGYPMKQWAQRLSENSAISDALSAE